MDVGDRHASTNEEAGVAVNFKTKWTILQHSDAYGMNRSDHCHFSNLDLTSVPDHEQQRQSLRVCPDSSHRQDALSACVQEMDDSSHHRLSPNSKRSFNAESTMTQPWEVSDVTGLGLNMIMGQMQANTSSSTAPAPSSTTTQFTDADLNAIVANIAGPTSSSLMGTLNSAGEQGQGYPSHHHPHHHQFAFREEEMESWLQYPLEDGLTEANQLWHEESDSNRLIQDQLTSCHQSTAHAIANKSTRISGPLVSTDLPDADISTISIRESNSPQRFQSIPSVMANGTGGTSLPADHNAVSERDVFSFQHQQESFNGVFSSQVQLPKVSGRGSHVTKIGHTESLSLAPDSEGGREETPEEEARKAPAVDCSVGTGIADHGWISFYDGSPPKISRTCYAFKPSKQRQKKLALNGRPHEAVLSSPGHVDALNAPFQLPTRPNEKKCVDSGGEGCAKGQQHQHHPFGGQQEGMVCDDNVAEGSGPHQQQQQEQPNKKRNGDDSSTELVSASLPAQQQAKLPGETARAPMAHARSSSISGPMDRSASLNFVQFSRPGLVYGRGSAKKNILTSIGAGASCSATSQSADTPNKNGTSVDVTQGAGLIKHSRSAMSLSRLMADQTQLQKQLSDHPIPASTSALVKAWQAHSGDVTAYYSSSTGPLLETNVLPATASRGPSSVPHAGASTGTRTPPQSGAELQSSADGSSVPSARRWRLSEPSPSPQIPGTTGAQATRAAALRSGSMEDVGSRMSAAIELHFMYPSHVQAPSQPSLYAPLSSHRNKTYGVEDNGLQQQQESLDIGHASTVTSAAGVGEMEQSDTGKCGPEEAEDAKAWAAHTGSGEECEDDPNSGEGRKKELGASGGRESRGRDASSGRSSGQSDEDIRQEIPVRDCDRQGQGRSREDWEAPTGKRAMLKRPSAMELQSMEEEEEEEEEEREGHTELHQIVGSAAGTALQASTPASMRSRKAGSPEPSEKSAAKRARAAEVHNLSERRRRDRINERMKMLQELIPNSNKTDKASMLDEAIHYLKMLQLQLHVMSVRSGIGIPLQLAPPTPTAYPSPYPQSFGFSAMPMAPRLPAGGGLVPNAPVPLSPWAHHHHSYTGPAELVSGSGGGSGGSRPASAGRGMDGVGGRGVGGGGGGGGGASREEKGGAGNGEGENGRGSCSSQGVKGAYQMGGASGADKEGNHVAGPAGSGGGLGPFIRRLPSSPSIPAHERVLMDMAASELASMGGHQLPVPGQGFGFEEGSLRGGISPHFGMPSPPLTVSAPSRTSSVVSTSSASPLYQQNPPMLVSSVSYPGGHGSSDQLATEPSYDVPAWTEMDKESLRSVGRAERHNRLESQLSFQHHHGHHHAGHPSHIQHHLASPKPPGHPWHIGHLPHQSPVSLRQMTPQQLLPSLVDPLDVFLSRQHYLEHNEHVCSRDSI